MKMDDELELFQDNKYIRDLVENKIYLLKNNPDFSEKYKKLARLMGELENELNEKQKEKWDKVIQLLYQIEEYNLVLAYSWGVKHGKDAKK